MTQRVRIDDPGIMEGILEDVRARPREHWLQMLERYENERPGDIILPGVVPRQAESKQPRVATSDNTVRAKRRQPKRREAV